jgi:hypothetical protein
MGPQYQTFRAKLAEAGMRVQTIGEIKADLIAVHREGKPPVLAVVNDKGADGYSLYILAPGIQITDDVHRMATEDWRKERISIMTRKKMRVGDLLTFKAATRASYRKATRKITGFDNYGRPLVSYAGWQGFIVQPKEIISVERAKWTFFNWA